MSGRRRPGERGSMSVELAMIAPMIFLVFALIYAYGRVGQVNGLLESGTRDAARSATMARSHPEAQQRAERAVRDAISGAPQACRDSLVVDVQGQFLPDEPITVVATCRYPLSDLGLPGAIGTMSPESSFTSMLDPYRGIEP